MKVSPEYYDEIFPFKGEWDMESSCGLKIRVMDGKTYVYKQNDYVKPIFKESVTLYVTNDFKKEE